jgi:hypothetical protein
VPQSHAQESGVIFSAFRVSIFLLPSAADLIFIVLFFTLTYGALAPAMLGDADIGWHIRNGQNILATHTIPHIDSFSATMSGHPWFAWEWLYDAAIAFIDNHAGLNGVVAFSAFVIALTFALVFRFTLKRGASLLLTLLFLVPCLVAASIHFLARPHVVGWLMTIIWFWILDSSQQSTFERGRADPSPILLCLLMLIWVNLHGSFVMGFVLLAIYGIADLVTAFRAYNDARANALVHARMLGAVSALSVLISLLNPYGYKLHIHVYQYLSSRFLMQHIQEFRAPNFHGIPAQFFLVLVVLAAVTVVAARAHLRWADGLIIAFSVISGFWAARNLPVASMLLTVVCASVLSKRWNPSPSNARSSLALVAYRIDQMQQCLRGHLWPVILVTISTGVCLNQGELCGRQVMNAHFSEQRFPVRAVDFLVQNRNHEPIFSLDSAGGYLIYRLYPDTKVFIDDRHDFYGEAYLKNYLKVIHIDPDWERVLDSWQVNLIILPTDSRIAQAIGATPNWRTAYSDQTATVFRRR